MYLLECFKYTFLEHFTSVSSKLCCIGPFNLSTHGRPIPKPNCKDSLSRCHGIAKFCYCLGPDYVHLSWSKSLPGFGQHCSQINRIKIRLNLGSHIFDDLFSSLFTSCSNAVDLPLPKVLVCHFSLVVKV